MWFVLINRDRRVLAVYGSALRDMADAKLEELLPFAQLVEWAGNRPHVNEFLPEA